MSVTLVLSPESEATLKKRAAGAGQDPSAYASSIIEKAINRPSLDELLEPIRAEFAASGMTDEQLSDFLEDAKHEMRREHRETGRR